MKILGFRWSCMSLAVALTLRGVYRSALICFRGFSRTTPRQMDFAANRVSRFDVLSIGSVTRPEYLQAQLETWGRHPSIRSFIGVTELGDYDPNCDRMTTHDVYAYIDACRVGQDVDIYGPQNTEAASIPVTLQHMARKFAALHYGTTESSLGPQVSVTRVLPGWHCAQRRVLQGMNFLQNLLYFSHTKGGKNLPDYLVVTDDDTYFNAHAFGQQTRYHNPSVPRVYSGCLFERNVTSGQSLQWEFPYGGFGVVYSKGAVKNLLEPLHCTSSPHDHRDHEELNDKTFHATACRALRKNQIGERVFYRPGMNVIELFSNYSAFSKQFCLHSDWLVGFIAGQYLAVERNEDSEHTTFHAVQTWPYQCGNHSIGLPGQTFCHADSTFCHRQTVQDFERYHAEVSTSLDTTAVSSSLLPSSLLPSSSSFLRSETDAWLVNRLKGGLKQKGPYTNIKDIAKLVADHFSPRNAVSPRTTVDASVISSKTAEDGRAWVERLYNDTVVKTNAVVLPSNFTSMGTKQTEWVTSRQMLPESFDQRDDLALALHQLRYGKIVKASVPTSANQLKLLLELEGGAEAIFKPKRGGIGMDRHTSEIASWHLSRLLNLRRAPISIGRIISVPDELFPVASEDLNKTFVSPGCFHGICNDGCDPLQDTPTCGENGLLEGVMILVLPKQYHDKVRGREMDLIFDYQPTSFPYIASGPQATHKRRRMLSSPDYCDAVVKPEVDVEPRLLDIVETSIFDWLIQNTDRSTYEIIQSRDKDDSMGNDMGGTGAIMFLDQGKSFGSHENGTHDIPDLLFPLTQCCILRDTTYDHLQWIRRWEFPLSEALVRLTVDEVTTALSIAQAESGETLSLSSNKILFDGDLAALDRRLNILFDAIDTCIQERGEENVLMPTFEYS